MINIKIKQEDVRVKTQNWLCFKLLLLCLKREWGNGDVSLLLWSWHCEMCSGRSLTSPALFCCSRLACGQASFPTHSVEANLSSTIYTEKLTSGYGFWFFPLCSKLPGVDENINFACCCQPTFLALLNTGTPMGHQFFSCKHQDTGHISGNQIFNCCGFSWSMKRNGMVC